MGIDVAEERRQREIRESLVRQKREAAAAVAVVQKPQKVTRLDCQVCKNEQTMEATTVSRFGPLIRLIGYLIAIPSVLGVAFAAFGAIGTMLSGSDPEFSKGINTAATGFALTFSLLFGGGALISGTVGYLLLTKRKVWRCSVCAHILERG